MDYSICLLPESRYVEKDEQDIITDHFWHLVVFWSLGFLVCCRRPLVIGYSVHARLIHFTLVNNRYHSLLCYTLYLLRCVFMQNDTSPNKIMVYRALRAHVGIERINACMRAFVFGNECSNKHFTFSSQRSNLINFVS